MTKMRYGNQYLKNLVKNSEFDTTAYWQTDTAIYHDSLELFDIPVQGAGNYFYQSIPPESLASFIDDTLLLAADLVSDGFAGAGTVGFQYIYGVDTSKTGQHPYGNSIPIPHGTVAAVSQYNLASYSKYHPSPPGGQIYVEARVGIRVSANAGNAGTLYLDNVRLEPVSPQNDYSRMVNFDTLKTWTLIPGNGARKVYGQFLDGAGNETAVLWDTIIADTTKPARKISSPQNGQKVNRTVAIRGYAYDPSDPAQHFHKYQLQYTSTSQEWQGIDPDSLSYTPVYPTLPPFEVIGQWNTRSVIDGWYDLRLVVTDSAGNVRDTMISVRVSSDIVGPDGMYSGFANDVFGLAASDDILISEAGTGKVYRYDAGYQLLDTFRITDPSGAGLAYMMTQDQTQDLWVSDHTSQKVSRFTADGTLIYQLAEGFALPSGLALDPAGNLWVSDRLHDKVKRFDGSGNKTLEIGTRGTGPGQLWDPLGIAVKNDRVLVADSKNHRITMFDTLGNFQGLLGGANLGKPCGVAIDSLGYVYVTDIDSNRVIAPDPAGTPVFTVDSVLDLPTSVSLSGDQDRLYVTDTRHKRVLVYRVRGEPTPSGGAMAAGDHPLDQMRFQVMPTLGIGNFRISLQGLTGQHVRMCVYDAAGRCVNKLHDGTVTASPVAIAWSGDDDQGRRLGQGVYFVTLIAPDLNKTSKVVLVK